MNRRSERSAAAADDGGVGLRARDDSPDPAPRLDERGASAIEIALDHAASHAAGVDVATFTDVDADVAHTTSTTASKGEEVTGAKPGGT